MFIWSDDYKVDYKIIDEQHKKLFQIGLELEELVINYDAIEDIDIKVDGLYKKLVDYTDFHFKEEEEILKSIHYSDFELHKRKHREFIKSLYDIDLNVTHAKKEILIFKTLQLVAKWIQEHIQGDDFSYKYELHKEKGNGIVKKSI